MVSSINTGAVMDAFKRGDYARAGHFYTDGTTVYTYAVALASKREDGSIYLRATMLKEYSKTSKAHQNAVRANLPDETPYYSKWSGEFGTLGNPPAELPPEERY